MKNAQQKSDLNCRINRARLAGAMHNYTLAEFKNYILELGLTKYEQVFMPVKTNKLQAEEFTHVAKIIPFPGVLLSDHFQDEIDDFLREMGYIE